MLFKKPHKVTRNLKSVRATKNSNKQIFVDKIVDQRTNPTLFNIESARATLLTKLGPTDNLQAARSQTKRTNQQAIATEVLAKMNVLMVDIPRSYSLLESNSDKDAIENPYILDRLDFKNTVNNTVTAEDKFVHVGDPFYQLDDMPNMNKNYVTTKSTLTKKSVSVTDPSFIVSNLAILNNSPSYFGKNKYL